MLRLKRAWHCKLKRKRKKKQKGGKGGRITVLNAMSQLYALVVEVLNAMFRFKVTLVKS